MDSEQGTRKPGRKPRGTAEEYESPEEIQRLIISKFSDVQKRAYDMVRNRKGRNIVLRLHRRCGKSYFCVSMALIQGLEKPQQRIVYVAPLKAHAKEIVQPLVEEVLYNAGVSWRPKFNLIDNSWTFPNGSSMFFAASERGQADRYRGPRCDMAVFDEEGLADNCVYMVRSVLMPSIISSDGYIIHASSATDSPSHPYMVVVNKAKEEGYLLDVNVDQNPGITEAMRKEYCDECGGEDTTVFKREYLNQEITEEKYAVFPEITRGEVELGTVCEAQRKSDTDRVYGSVDFRGQTVLLVCAYDSYKKVYCIKEEKVIDYGSVYDVKNGLETLRKDSALFVETKPQLEGSLREAGIRVNSVDSLDLENTFGFIRYLLKEKRLRIDPQCSTLIKHMKDGVWERDKKGELQVSGDVGRFDALKSLGVFVTGAPKSNGYMDLYMSKSVRRRIHGQILGK